MQEKGTGGIGDPGANVDWIPPYPSQRIDQGSINMNKKIRVELMAIFKVICNLLQMPYITAIY